MTGKPIRIVFIAILKIVFIILAACDGNSTGIDSTGNSTQLAPATGPLAVHSSNPRYFQDPNGTIHYLTGAHTWQNLQDRGRSDPPPVFNYTNYLDLLENHNHNHNFIRMWRWEFPKFRYKSSSAFQYSEPHPWARAGRETALDGKPKFDLTKFNQAYFDRLRTRIIAAKDRGIYVSIMLFEGHALQFASEAWFSHPFNVENNVNGIDGDLNKDGRGLELHTLDIPSVTAIQEAYVRKVIDTVNDLDNVLYEIANESHGGSDAWQQHMIDYIHFYEVKKPKQHPVVYSAAWGDDGSELWASRAEAISPGWDGKNWAISPYRDDPPANDGRKVIINDTDHLWGTGGNQGWVWKSFVRGLNPIFMDSYNDSVYPNITNMPAWPRLKTALSVRLGHLIHAIRGQTVGSIHWKESIRRNMGYTLMYANKMNLAAMVPGNDLASTKYCLANPGEEYLVYLPSSGSVTVDLSASSGMLNVEWFDPTTGATMAGETITGGANRSFISPFSSDAVLYIKADSGT